MPSPLVVKSPMLKPLGALASVQKGGAAYYRELKGSPDRYIAAGAWCTMLESKLMTYNLEQEVFAYCGHAAVRARAFAYFESVYEHDLARKAAKTPATPAADIEQKAMLAELAQDDLAGAEAAGERYLASGDLTNLRVASEKAERAGGWRASLEWALRAVAIAPLNPVPVQRLFMVLASSAQPDVVEETAEILRGRNLHLQVAQIFLAASAMMRRDPRLCLTRLKPLDEAKIAANPALIF